MSFRKRMRGGVITTSHVLCPIRVTKHAVGRYCERNLMTPCREIEARIKKEVQRSRLFGLKNGFEHRERNGNVFVCKRERDELVVITVLLSVPKKYANFGSSFI